MMRTFVLAATLLLPSNSAPEVMAGRGVTDTVMHQNDIMMIFTMRERRWRTGQPIQVLIYPQASPYQIQFLYDILGVSGYAYQIHINRAIFLGRQPPPRVVTTPQEMLSALSDIPYSIGYVNHALVTSDNNGGLTVIRIVP